MLDPDEILAEMGDWQGYLLFLGNDGRQLFGDARLSVFRSSEDWAVFVELPHYMVPAIEFCNWIGFAGACREDFSDSTFRLLENSSGLDETDVPALHNDGRWIGDRAAFSIVLRGVRHDFKPTDDDYAAAGITFSDDAMGAGSLEPSQLLRYVSHHLNHPFLASEASLRSFLLPEVREEMTPFLQTALWQHPLLIADFVEDDDPDFIPNIPCWQILARAIASGDLSEWHAQDPATFNTSWPALDAINRQNSDWERWDWQPWSP
jgi:hypothetical protein